MFLKNPLDNTVNVSQKHVNHTAMAINPKKERVAEKKCDLFKGRWIPDLNGSLYTNWSCPTMPSSKNCHKHGRKDVDYMNWRWKPNECELPRFNPKTFLSVVHGKKLAFIGDSVARNQMESLLCLLSQGQTPKDFYKDSEDRFRTFYFPSHNFTLMVHWVRFLVVAEERGINGTTKTYIFDIHLDKIDISWAQRLRDLDYAVISDAHWFFRKNYLYEGGRQIGCIYCDEPNVPDLGVPFAVGKAFGSVLEYINDCKECKKGLVTFLRTFSPAHFEHGSWNGGGTCNRTSPYTEEQINLASTEMEVRSVQVKEFEKIKKRTEGKRFEILDITRAMIMRPDGHPDLHWDNQYMKGHSDCIHWCLPGPIDVWNDLLMAVLQKEDGHSTHSSS
ncbi:protein ALTERED XYLOGLUCAN 4-like [Papaver somniferum]|uniref:protein ALTERED XYLOGLUCAN 4-like n=1 Tax=Papaver somniferum TaxID=3469 RepID=UPI000E702BBA|nr:protein ALTERED XYLOGLUCAN 4-like [Papaver somniferum]